VWCLVLDCSFHTSFSLAKIGFIHFLSAMDESDSYTYSESSETEDVDVTRAAEQGMRNLVGEFTMGA